MSNRNQGLARSQSRATDRDQRKTMGPAQELRDWPTDPASVARLLAETLGREGMTARRGTDAEHAQIDAGWPERIPPAPFA